MTFRASTFILLAALGATACDPQMGDAASHGPAGAVGKADGASDSGDDASAALRDSCVDYEFCSGDIDPEECVPASAEFEAFCCAAAPTWDVEFFFCEPPAEDLPAVQLGDTNDPGDFYAIASASIEGDVLTMVVTHGGGCAEHDYELNWNGALLKSLPPQATLQLHHDANGDNCEALLTETLSFDLTPLQAADPFGEIIINLDMGPTGLSYTYLGAEPEVDCDGLDDGFGDCVVEVDVTGETCVNNLAEQQLLDDAQACCDTEDLQMCGFLPPA